MERTKPGRSGEESSAPYDDVPVARAQGNGSQLSADETQQLLRRAAELERSRGQTSPEVALDFREVERIGLEAGLSREAIQRAFAELRTGGLAPTEAPGLAERWMGPLTVTAHTLSPLEAEDARKKLHAILKGELLHPEERKGSRTTWTPAPGLWATIQRGLNWRGQAAWHRGTVVSEVSEAPAGMDNARALVRLEAASNDRTQKLWGALAPALVLLPVSVISAFAPHAMHQGVPFMIAGMAVFGSGTALLGVRAAYRKRIKAMRVAIERVIDKLNGEHQDD